MLTISVPGIEVLQLQHLVLDFNGTLACDGLLLEGVAERLRRLAQQMEVHVVTGDTFGTAGAALQGLPCRLVVLDSVAQAEAKRDYVQRLGANTVACIGNGRNDSLMAQAAALSIVVMQAEGASSRTLVAADVVMRHVQEALELLLHPLRLAATLRT